MREETNTNIVSAPRSDDGYRVGETATDKVSFYGKTPVAQQASAGEATGFTAGTGTAVQDVSTFTGDVGSTAYTISDIVKHLKTLGLIAE